MTTMRQRAQSNGRRPKRRMPARNPDGTFMSREQRAAAEAAEATERIDGRPGRIPLRPMVAVLLAGLLVGWLGGWATVGDGGAPPAGTVEAPALVTGPAGQQHRELVTTESRHDVG